MKTTPITPEEIKNVIEDITPDFVIEAVNNLLKEKYRGEYIIKITGKEVLREILRCSPADITEEIIYEKKYLNFELLYEKYGWIIKWISPDLDESFTPYYEIKRKPKDE